jgi:hypothetical protein
VRPPAAQDQSLPRRLRALRTTWTGHTVTQKHLAQAFSAVRSTSVPLISSWESTTSPKTPPADRLEAYARFFATERSILGSGAPRLLALDELDDAERTRYDELLAELTALESELRGHDTANGTTALPANGAWHFPDGFDALVVCARLPKDVATPYPDPSDPDYLTLYNYADLDSLVELFGHLRAMNPDSNVNFKTADQLAEDDYTKHLVLLGGVDWNLLSRELLPRVGIPVQQITRLGTDEPEGFEVEQEARTRMFTPTVRDGLLLEDVAHFYRGPNPFNTARTVTVCNGMFGRGTYGAVRALTDIRFRERNDTYLRDQLEQHGKFSLLMRVELVAGKVMTPDWTLQDTRLHQWPEDGSS